MGGEISVKTFHQTLVRDCRISNKEEKTDDRGIDKILDEQDFYSRSLRCQGDFRQARSQEVRFQVVDLTDRSTSGRCRTVDRPTDGPRDGRIRNLEWTRQDGGKFEKPSEAVSQGRKKETDAKPLACRTDRRTTDGRKDGRRVMRTDGFCRSADSLPP